MGLGGAGGEGVWGEEGWQKAGLTSGLLLTVPGPTQAQGKGGGLASYLGENKAVVVRVPGIQCLVAHGVEEEDSHDLSSAAA